MAVEVNSETDFVARNADFQSFVSGAAKTALGLTQGAAAGVGDMEKAALLAAKGPTGVCVCVCVCLCVGVWVCVCVCRGMRWWGVLYTAINNHTHTHKHTRIHRG